MTATKTKGRKNKGDRISELGLQAVFCRAAIVATKNLRTLHIVAGINPDVKIGELEKKLKQIKNDPDYDPSPEPYGA